MLPSLSDACGPLPMMRAILWAVVLTLCSDFRIDAQTVVHTMMPQACRPGETTKVTLYGKDLHASLRAIAAHAEVTIAVEKVEPQQATLAVTVPSKVPLGAIEILFATDAGAVGQLASLIDDVPLEIDNSSNHSRETAQAIPPLCSVSGTSDGPASDFYKLQVTQGQRIAFEVHSQLLRSKMDPLMQLSDANGEVVRQVDDSDVGPDFRFSHTFEHAGEYWIEIRDSKFAAGHAYYLRVGDFPIVSHANPPAVPLGSTTTVAFRGQDGDRAEPYTLVAAADGGPSGAYAPARFADGHTSSLVPVSFSPHPQVIEPAVDDKAAAQSPAPHIFPVGISGTLATENERDRFAIQGVVNQTVRISARGRSLGCPTMLQMSLLNAANNKVAETAVNEADEWSFDYTFPDDGVYQLEVSDLLHRGGNDFGYLIEIKPAGRFSLSLKAAAETKELYSVEPGVGAAAVDLAVDRFGYAGAIEISLTGATDGLRLLDPLIPADAKEMRVYIATTEAWRPDSLSGVRLVGRAATDTNVSTAASSIPLQRIKNPHIPFPSGAADGLITIAGLPPTEKYFELTPSSPIDFARQLPENSVQLSLKRLNAEFKTALLLKTAAVAPDFKVLASGEGDTYQIKLIRESGSTHEPNHIDIYAISDFQNRSRVEPLSLPIHWIDPVKVNATVSGPVIGGTPAILKVRIDREGGDPQPVTLQLSDLPVGITAASESLVVPADQSDTDITLNVSTDVASTQAATIKVTAASQYRSADITAVAHSAPFAVIAPPKTLAVYPAEVVLRNARDIQQLVITGTDSAGNIKDWTRQARIASQDAAVANVDGSVIRPAADGATTIEIDVAGQQQSIPVRVENQQTSRPIAFESELLVALSKQGCNSGACHGSPSGKGGFRLSLRAFDKTLDELTLIREDFGRRVDRIEPEKSLLLSKPLMHVEHGGGKQLNKSDAAYEIIHRWIREGVKTDPSETPRCIKLDVTPQEKQILRRYAGGKQLAATATFGDGTTRDVSHLVAYESSNTAVATVDASGWVEPHDRGETVILVRFLEHIESVPLMFIDQVSGFEWQSPPPNNYVDELVNAKLRQLQFVPAETCTDAEFVRRVYLDVIGILPTVDETRQFLGSDAIDKRAKLIDQLLDRDEYAQYWALKWGDLLKMTSKLVGDEGVHKYHRWVEDAFRTNMPYDQFARELLASSGSTLTNPPANFYRTAADMNECVETISQVFLGTRLQCAKCHNHPFERWTQDNYYGLGAFFQRVQRKKTQRPGEMFVWTAAAGEVIQPRTGQTLKPWLPQTGDIDPASLSDRRERFVEWLIDVENPYFAKIEVNRIWAQLFARGIVDPVDDFRDSNPPCNAPLLDALASDFVKNGFDRKHILRTILNSRTYQASTKTVPLNEADEIYFSHQQPRFLSAEQLLDSINQTLGLDQSFAGFPPGTKATQLPAPDVVKVDFLKVFGQPERSTVCACERADDSNLSMAIELFNGSLIHEKLRDGANRFRRADPTRSTEDIIREVYFAGLSREPNEVELRAALEHCAACDDRLSGIEDICWALLNTQEFLFQH